MTAYLEIVDTAGQSAAYAITLKLREHLVSVGWPSVVLDSIHVTKTKSGFGVSFEGPHAEDAMTLEYGTESRRPTGSIRKFLNNESLLYKLYFDQLEEELGELL